MTSKTIIAIDPGKMTGLAYMNEHWDHESLSLPYHRDDGNLAAMAWLADALAEGETADVVCESIIISKQTAKKSQDVQASIEQIGIARYLSAAYHVNFTLQTPAEMKAFSPQKLRCVDWYNRSSDHARDASGHLLLFEAKRNEAFQRWILSCLQEAEARTRPGSL